MDCKADWDFNFKFTCGFTKVWHLIRLHHKQPKFCIWATRELNLPCNVKRSDITRRTGRDRKVNDDRVRKVFYYLLCNVLAHNRAVLPCTGILFTSCIGKKTEGMLASSVASCIACDQGLFLGRKGRYDFRFQAVWKTTACIDHWMLGFLWFTIE